MEVIKQLIIVGLLLFSSLTALADNLTDVTDTPISHNNNIAQTDIMRNSLSVRANLLRWATLTPDIGVEWRINRNLGIAVNGCWTSWSWDDKNRRYALREIAPEVRWYLGSEHRGYVGAMYKAGAFNYKFSETGRQGNINGCGVTGGYILPLNKCLSLDFSFALGYLHAHYDIYNVTDGVRVRTGNERKNWFGPINAGVTLTWTIL